MSDVRPATVDDVDLLARIAAAGFYDDPVLSWVFNDPDQRLAQLTAVFTDLVRDYLPGRGTVHVVDDACVSFWRDPSFEHGRTTSDRARESADETPFPPDCMERMETLGQAMMSAHPHEQHWYLNVISTLPDRQGQGLGTRIFRPVLAVCDAEGIPAYLESTNPRNMALYRRQGFRDMAEIPLRGGPSIYPMWRDPR
jgi:ribosomal protein S18 acetylase RimI-like enzyme